MQRNVAGHDHASRRNLPSLLSSSIQLNIHIKQQTQASPAASPSASRPHHAAENHSENAPLDSLPAPAPKPQSALPPPAGSAPPPLAASAPSASPCPTHPGHASPAADPPHPAAAPRTSTSTLATL